MSREQDLENALRAFMRLDWAPDAAPDPSCYCVYPVADARKAMQTAGMLLDGKSPFPSDIDGSVMETRYADGKIARSV